MQPAHGQARSRIDRARSELTNHAIQLLLIAPSSDLLYLTGEALEASERPILLAILHDGTVLLLAPELEASRLARHGEIPVVPYRETDDPYAELRTALVGEDTRVDRIAISDRAWASTVLGLQRVFPESSFVPASGVLRSLRITKDTDELGHLRKAGRAVDEAFNSVVDSQFAGRTEDSIATQLNDLVGHHGLEAAGWGPIVASGSNSAFPHHASGDRIIREGDTVVLDFGGVHGGYQADITRTVHVGTPSKTLLEVYSAVKAAQQAGIEAVAPGASAEAVDAAARSVIEAHGYGRQFVHRTGHGIGLDEHEDPYLVAGNQLALRPGMVFTVEPGIYLPGRFGVRIEDSVALTDSGVERLNNSTRDLVIVR